MGHILNQRGKDLCQRISDLSENKIHDIWFGVKVVVASLAFLGVVTIWDTLPSLPAIHSVEVTHRVSDTNVDVVYKYDVLYSGDFRIAYELTHDGRSSALSSVDALVIGTQSPTSHVKKFKLDPGSWCVTADLSWKKGFSLRSHSQELPKTCFTIYTPVFNVTTPVQ